MNLFFSVTCLLDLFFSTLDTCPYSTDATQPLLLMSSSLLLELDKSDSIVGSTNSSESISLLSAILDHCWLQGNEALV